MILAFEANSAVTAVASLSCTFFGFYLSVQLLSDTIDIRQDLCIWKWWSFPERTKKAANANLGTVKKNSPALLYWKKSVCPGCHWNNVFVKGFFVCIKYKDNINKLHIICSIINSTQRVDCPIDMTRHNTIRHDTTPYDTTRHNTTQKDTKWNNIFF